MPIPVYGQWQYISEFLIPSTTLPRYRRLYVTSEPRPAVQGEARSQVSNPVPHNHESGALPTDPHKKNYS